MGRGNGREGTAPPTLPLQLLLRLALQRLPLLPSAASSFQCVAAIATAMSRQMAAHGERGRP